MRRTSLWGKIRSVVTAPTEDMVKQKPAAPLVVPRVMITPNTPETSSGSDWSSDDDDDIYYPYAM